MTLHDRIKRLEWVSEPCNREALLERQSDYADGLCDGVNGAAMLAKEADELMAEMAEALSDVNRVIAEGSEHGFNYEVGDWAERLFFSQQRTSNAIKAHITYKEQNNE